MRNDSFAGLFASRHCLTHNSLMKNDTPSDRDDKERLDRLSYRDESSAANLGYSRFIRVMRLILPLAAICVVVFLFVRPGVEETLVVPIENVKSEIKDQHVVKNELLNPEFESMDKNKQPYKITADRAIQGEKNKDLVMLDRPVGVMTMKDGVTVRMRSDTGAYRQDTQRFFLQGSVSIEHDAHYSLRSEEAHIDLEKNFTWSEKQVQGQGPDIAIDAKGVRADGKTGEIIFTGPAKLVLENGLEGLE